MILSDLVTDMILKTNALITKKGQDAKLRRDVVTAINAITGEDSLDTIYINNVDQFNIPDVFVMPLYNKDFNLYIMDGDLSDVCPFGYTLEIHQRCFEKYNAEELTAIIIHDILQNVQSCSAKSRFLTAYNKVTSDYKIADILDIFDDISHSEVTYIAMMDICARPFRVPVCGFDYVGTDEVLRNMNLGDAYDSALIKLLDMSNNTPDEAMANDLDQDYKTLKTVVGACRDRTIRAYYTMIKDALPFVTLNNVLNVSSNSASIGFVSRKKNYKRRYELEKAPAGAVTLTESFINPKNEIEIRFQVDKLITELRYMATEDERQVLLVKIRNLTIKLAKTGDKLDQSYQKNPTDKNLKYKLDYLSNFMVELEGLRKQVVETEIKEKKWGIWAKLPVGYEY